MIMTKSEILEKLKAGQVDLEFIKADGTLRQMSATLSESLFSIKRRFKMILRVRRQVISLYLYGILKLMVGGHLGGTA